MYNVPLPPRPNLDQYKKRAKELVAATESSDAGAVLEWARDWIRSLAKILGADVDGYDRQAFESQTADLADLVRKQREKSKSGRYSLADAQFLIAQAHGFKNWKTFRDELTQVTRLGSDAQRLEAAVDAIVSGDIETLTALLEQHPDLARSRSHRAHRCTLLHYISANGVEDFRQKTPPNSVAIARALLDAGAEVDALAETYGGGRGQTTMNLLVSSAHPDIAGLQGELASVLLDYGAAIEGLDDDGSPIQTALAFGYIRTAETLARRGARIGNITVAASLGRLDLVQQFVNGELPEPKESLLQLYWSGVPRDRALRQLVAFHWSCSFGRTEVVKYFLDLGMDPARPDDNRMTPLHNACTAPHMDIVRMLLARKVPLEQENVWGGTVLGSTLHFVNEARRWRPERIPQYVECIEALIAAGADLSAIDYVMGIPEIDSVLDRHRPRPPA